MNGLIYMLNFKLMRPSHGPSLPTTVEPMPEKRIIFERITRLVESPGLLNYNYFPTYSESDICVQVFILILHIKNRACEMKGYLKNAGQDNICHVYGALTC